MKYNSPITTAWEAGEDEIEKNMTSGFVKTKRGGWGKGANHNFSSALKGRIVAKQIKDERSEKCYRDKKKKKKNHIYILDNACCERRRLSSQGGEKGFVSNFNFA